MELFMNRYMKRAWLMLGLMASISACTPVDRIVLLPNLDGSPSAVVVHTAAGERVLDRPYDAVGVSGSGNLSTLKETPESVKERYGNVLAALPQRPVSYLVYFEEGQNTISAQSQGVIDEIKADILKRKAPEIVIIGHTDRVGSVESNDALSLQRAGVVRDILLADGITALRVEIEGRGEREPLVATADEVAEAKNRRVEIIVR